MEYYIMLCVRAATAQRRQFTYPKVVDSTDNLWYEHNRRKHSGVQLVAEPIQRSSLSSQ